MVTSFNAMSEFAKAIGGDKVEVSTIIPDGTEPHDFELKPENMKQLASAQVFVITDLAWNLGRNKRLMRLKTTNLYL